MKVFSAAIKVISFTTFCAAIFVGVLCFLTMIFMMFGFGLFFSGER